MADRIRVGIVGANLDYGWGTRAHLPALAAVPEFEVRAVCTTRMETARATADRFGVPLAFDNVEAMANHPEVDLIVVAVRVPSHYALVKAALDAGKHVFCEWPLGANLREAIELRDLAHAKGVIHQVGLQGRSNPAINQVRDLIAAGEIGEVVSATMVVSGSGAGARAGTLHWQIDKDMGATVLTIQGGHAIDSLRYALGEIAALSATVRTLFPDVVVQGTNEVLHPTAPDNVVVDAELANGALVAMHIETVPVLGSGFHLEVRGTEGTVLLRGESAPNTAELTVLLGKRGEAALDPLALSEAYQRPPGTPSGAPANVSQVYRELAAAIGSGGTAPVTADFDTAVELHRIIDAIERASDSGQRQRL